MHRLAIRKPQRIYLAGRSAEKATKALDSLKAKLDVSQSSAISFLPLDLASLESIRDAARTFHAKESRLDLLVNNAGVMTPPPALTTDGYEIQFGTNHVGHAAFTRLLMPALLRTAQQPDADVRVISVASGAEAWAPKEGLKLGQVKSKMEEMSGIQRYGQSKLSNILYSRAMSKEFPSILFAAIHPGGVQSNLSQGAKASYPMIASAITMVHRMVTVPVEKGAWNQLWAATAPRALVHSGKYYLPVMRESKGSSNAQRKDIEEELWAWTEGEFERHEIPKVLDVKKEVEA